MLKFEIVSSRTVDPGDKGEKRYVAYMVQVRRGSVANSVDPNPASVERRYTDFQKLYYELRKDFPAEMAQVTFPKKVVMGNFDRELISTRRIGFEALLQLIGQDSRLRDAPATVAFLQLPERTDARRLLEEKAYGPALYILETSFKLLNKVYTDASPPVLCTLCRVVACASLSRGELAPPGERWGTLALRRYQTVSDADLLLLYAPLLRAVIKIWDTLGKDKSTLESELDNLHKRGMKIDGGGLMEAVDKFEGLDV